MLVDKSCIPFYGIVELTGQFLNQAIHNTVISQLKEDAILGMPFLEKHECHIDFCKSVVMEAGHELTGLTSSVDPWWGSACVANIVLQMGRAL